MTDSATPAPRDGRRSPDAQDNGTETAQAGSAAKAKMPVWLFRTILGVAAAVVLVVVYLIASVTVPLMWADSISDQIGGQLGNSIPLGMFYGFVFSFVPVTVAWQAHHRGLNKWVRVSLVALGLLLTIPNLLTLAVLFGGTQTAADARSKWANGANWFGTWSQIFMVVGVVCAVALIVLGRMWLRRGRKIREIKAAEKLVREDKLARTLSNKEAAREAEKQARIDARTAEKAARNTARTLRRQPAPASDGASPENPGPDKPATDGSATPGDTPPA